MGHMMRGTDLVRIGLIVVHLLSQELDFLLLEVARAYQLRPVHSLVVSLGSASRICHAGLCTLRWDCIPLVATFE